MRRLWPLPLLALLAACGQHPPARPAKPIAIAAPYRLAHASGPGPIELIGGGASDDGLVAHFLALAGGPDARLVVVPWASGADGHGALYRDRLIAAGAHQVSVLTASQAALDADRELIRQADGLFFPGGLPDVLSVAFAPLVDATRTAWQGGCAIGGTSAGAMVWGSRWIARGEATDVLAHGLDAAAGGVALAPGWGFVENTLVDPHFSQRSRFYRLWLASTHEHALGLGLDEQTAACFEGDGHLRCVGAGSLTLIRPDAAGPARVTVLTNGQSAAWRDWAITAP